MVSQVPKFASIFSSERFPSAAKPKRLFSDVLRLLAFTRFYFSMNDGGGSRRTLRTIARIVHNPPPLDGRALQIPIVRELPPFHHHRELFPLNAVDEVVSD